ncbi:MAG: peptide-methionine (R)-S-oxide reductase MsrB [Gammaproteobacteria bacterium]|nr:peptide-methionine (R)-S-oxide reductase MsrB [Gammaproteobacteria bacterium]
MNRRAFVTVIASAFSGLLAGGRAFAASLQEIRTGWRDFAPDGAEFPRPGQELARSREAWQEVLEPLPFRVLREAHTERAGSSVLNGEKRRGLYVCAGCDLPLFTSQMKFDSGTGWPSFFTTIPDVFETKLDFVWLVPRTEYHCVRCGGHHGHVFDDGPPPTHERWCNNGAALRFIPSDA